MLLGQKWETPEDGRPTRSQGFPSLYWTINV